MNYKVHQGSLAFMLHRLTGVMLIGYLIVHIMALTGLHDPVTWHEKMLLFTTPVFSFVEYLLFLPILFHSLNGIRLIIVEWTDNGSKNHKKMFAAVLVVSVILAGVMGMVFMGHTAYDADAVEKYNKKFETSSTYSHCKDKSSCDKLSFAKENCKDGESCENKSAYAEKCADCTPDQKCEKHLAISLKCEDCTPDKKCVNCVKKTEGAK